MQRHLFMRSALAVIMCTMAASKPLMAQLEQAEDVVRELQRQQLLLELKQRAEEIRLRPLDVRQRMAINAANLNRLRILPPNGGAFTLKLVEQAGKARFTLSTTRGNGIQALNQLELSKQDEEKIVRQFVSQGEAQCEELLHAAKINNQQLEKLKVAASLDAARLIRGLHADFSGTAEEQQSRNFNPLQAYANANNELKLGIINRQSLFRKVLRTLLTSEQRADLYQWRAAPLFEAINSNVNLSLDDQVRKLGLGYPKPGEETLKFAPLQPEQQASLLKLIVENHADLTDLLELAERYQTSSLLKNVREDQLSEFLSPPQVRAVLLQKQLMEAAIISRQPFLGQEFRFPVRIVPNQNPAPIPVPIP